MSSQPAGRYDAVAMSFHWGMALIILGLWAMGHVIGSLPRGPDRSDLIGLHATLGGLILVLALARLGWRLVRRPPRALPGLSALERLGAALVHAALYGLMLALPLVGILMAESGGHAVTLFGFHLPLLVDPDEGLHELFEYEHQALGWALALVLLAHIGAALRHHLLRKDDTLRRMLPGRG